MIKRLINRMLAIISRVFGTSQEQLLGEMAGFAFGIGKEVGVRDEVPGQNMELLGMSDDEQVGIAIAGECRCNFCESGSDGHQDAGWWITEGDADATYATAEHRFLLR